MAQNFSELANFLWSVADLLRGDYKQADYGKVILPFTLLRRLDCVLESTKEDVLAEHKKRRDSGVNLDPFLKRKSKQAFYNTSPFTLPGLLADQKHVRQNMVAYLGEFSEDARDVFERFKFTERVAELEDKNLLFQLVQKFASIDLHPEVVPNDTMGLVFEELIRKFAEASNETAGEHFTPREVIQLIVHCLFAGDDEALSRPGVVRSMYDPTAGTGGILSIGEGTARAINSSAVIRLFGQELNDESYAICKADMLIKGQDPKNIVRGNTLSADGFAGEKFDYGAANPPFGVDWKKVQDYVKTEHEKKGFAGRFGPGLPRVTDGSLLFLMHLISKMRPAAEGGGRVGIVLNGSPLFIGDAGSGESEIRRWILEHDLLEAIIALPTDLFYNTGIATYIWLLSNHKTADRKGKVQLIDATRMYAKMKRSLGNKRVYMTEAQIDEVVKVYACSLDHATFANEFVEPTKSGNGPGESESTRVASRVFDSKFFGYRKVTVDRPPQPGSPAGRVKKGQTLAYDPELRDTENVPLAEDINTYMKREVLPHNPDAFVAEDVRDEKDDQVGKVGYEISFNRYFYVYKPPRKPQVVARDVGEMEKRFLELLRGVESATEAFYQEVSKLMTQGLGTSDSTHRKSSFPELGSIPAHWEVKRLKFLGEVRSGVAKGKDLAQKSTVSLPYLRVANVQDGFLDLTEVHNIDVSESDAKRFLLRKGDVLMNEGGDNDKLGRGTIWEGQIDPCIHQNHVFAVRLHDLELAEWVARYTSTDAARSYFFLRSKQSTNLASINQSNVRELPVPVPPPAERKAILEHMRAASTRVQELTELAQEHIERLREYRISLISAAVTGQLELGNSKARDEERLTA